MLLCMFKHVTLSVCFLFAACSASEVLPGSSSGGSSGMNSSGGPVASDGGALDGGAPLVDGGGMLGDGGARPYGHVVPSDKGVKLGLGIAAAAPTAAYTGPLRITTSGLIQNVVIQGCLEIAADDVTLRNVSITCGAPYPIKIDGHKNLLVEYSRIEGTSGDKDFLISNSRNVVIRRNEIVGGEDEFFISGDVDGLTVAYNYMHALVVTVDSHADGFQIGEASATTGTITLRGNYISPDVTVGRNDVLFATTNAQNTIVFEDNFVRIFGLKTLRCGGTATCIVRHNVYEQAFSILNQPGFIGKLLFIDVQSPKPATFECNRLEDGTLLPEMQDGIDRVAGTTHITTNCPSL
jgi:hypothetical protein